MADADHLYFLARSRAREQTAGQFVAEVKDYLVRLAALLPELEELTAVGNSPKVKQVVRPAEPSFETTLLATLYDPKDVYVDLGPNRQLRMATRSRFGFGSLFYAGEWAKTAHVVRVWAGGSYPTALCDVHVEFPPEGDLRRRSPDLAERMFRLTVEKWRPAAAWLTSSWFRASMARSGKYTVGWLTYMTDPRVADNVPAGMSTEPFADGLLIRLDGQTFDAGPEQKAQALRLEEALASAGLLSMPPPTQGT